MESIHDEALKSRTLVFSEENLSEWLDVQRGDQKVKDFKYANNKEFINKLIDTFNISNKDKNPLNWKKSELQKYERYCKEFLQKNANFLTRLESIRT